MRLDRVEHFALVRQTDSAQFVTGKIHQPDFVERSGIDQLVKPLRMVGQMRMRVDTLHEGSPQRMNFGAVAVARSVAIVQFGWRRQ